MDHLRNKKISSFTYISVEDIEPSPLNTFSRYPADKYNELKASIESQGLLEPIIVRPSNCCQSYSIGRPYEILSGENRYLICKELKMETVKCTIYKTDDISASIIMTQSNIQREISEIELARSYRQTYDLMRSSYGGDRKSLEYRVSTGYHDGNLLEGKDKTLVSLAGIYGISPMTLYRKIRLTYLDETVLDKYVKGKITQNQAVHISYADKDMQLCLMGYYSSTDKNWIDNKRAEAIGKEAKRLDGKITPNQIDRIMRTTNNDSSAVSYKKESKYYVPACLFPSHVKKKDRQSYIEKALKFIRNNDIEL